jgi:hypothetical protein
MMHAMSDAGKRRGGRGGGSHSSAAFSLLFPYQKRVTPGRHAFSMVLVKVEQGAIWV